VSSSPNVSTELFYTLLQENETARFAKWVESLIVYVSFTMGERGPWLVCTLIALPSR
jgi:hypothetical protein